MKRIICLLTGLSLLGPLAAQQFFMDLSLNGERKLAVYPEQPVLLRISLSCPGAEQTLAENLQLQRRIGVLTDSIRYSRSNKQVFIAEKEKLEKQVRTPDSLVLGTVQAPWYSDLKWFIRLKDQAGEITLPLRLLPVPSSLSRVVLGAGRQASISYGIDPGLLKGVMPGTYLVTAKLGNTLSVQTELLIHPQTVPETVASSTGFLREVCRYYLQSGNAGKATAFADRLLQLDKGSLDAHSLKADCYYQLSQFKEAKEWYEKARVLYYQQHGNEAEAPGYLLTMLSLLQDKN